MIYRFLCIVFCRLLLVFLSLFFWPQCCLFFDLLLLITTLASSEFSSYKIHLLLKFIVSLLKLRPSDLGHEMSTLVFLFRNISFRQLAPKGFNYSSDSDSGMSSMLAVLFRSFSFLKLAPKVLIIHQIQIAGCRRCWLSCLGHLVLCSLFINTLIIGSSSLLIMSLTD